MLTKITAFLQKNRKKIGYTSIIGLLAYIFLFGNIGGMQTTFAQDDNTPSQEMQKLMNNRTEKGIIASKFLYIILWPLLVVAGFAMDNSMVYGAMFGFDVALRTIRNITKNIANFALAFLFLWGLGLVLIGKKENKHIAEVVKKTFLAGILIQASRFITAVAVDISTIATYGIGGLPISIMGEAKDEKPIAILTSEVYISMDENNKMPKVFLSTAEGGDEVWKISPCRIRAFQDEESKNIEGLIIGREDLYLGDIATKENMCHHYGDIYHFSKEIEKYEKEKGQTPTEKQSNYVISIDNFIADLNKQDNADPAKEQDSIKDKVTAYITSGSILQIDSGLFGNRSRVFQETAGQTDDKCQTIDSRINNIPSGAGIDTNKQKLIADAGSNVKITMLPDLLESSKSYVGVFAALYSSLVDANEFGLTNKVNLGAGTYSYFLNIMLNIMYLVVLIIPLAVTVIILLIRVIFLRVVIAIAPVIILVEVFKNTDSIKAEHLGESYAKYFSLENIGMVLIAPALISFAVSICTVCMAIIKSIAANQVCEEPTMSVLGLFDISISGAGVNFSKLFISVIGIGIVRFIMFAAVKTNSIGKAIGGKVQETAQNAIMNTPIIPLGKHGMASLSAFNPASNNNILAQFGNKMQEIGNDKSDKAMASLLGKNPATTGIAEYLYGDKTQEMRAEAMRNWNDDDRDKLAEAELKGEQYGKPYTERKERGGAERTAYFTSQNAVTNEEQLFKYINSMDEKAKDDSEKEKIKEEAIRKLLSEHFEKKEKDKGGKDNHEFYEKVVTQSNSKANLERVLRYATLEQKQQLHKSGTTWKRDNQRWQLDEKGELVLAGNQDTDESDATDSNS